MRIRDCNFVNRDVWKMKRILVLCLSVSALLFAAGCASGSKRPSSVPAVKPNASGAQSYAVNAQSSDSGKRLPAEDIEIFDLYPREIAVMKDPTLPPNSKEKYETIKYLIRKIDFKMTRETKTLNDLLFYGDALIDSPEAMERTITFNYQYGDNYVRLEFRTYGPFVFRVDITDK